MLKFAMFDFINDGLWEGIMEGVLTTVFTFVTISAGNAFVPGLVGTITGILTPTATLCLVLIFTVTIARLVQKGLFQ